jgi:pimeloyl-ACP methyl ester carboxylesterase
MPVTAAAGTDVHYAVTGAGSGLVLVHGASMDAASNFGHLLEQFADHNTVITPDCAGSGRTTAPPGELTTDLLVEQVAAVATDAATGPVDIVGFSLGAVVAARLAALRPELVRRLVLVAGWTHSADARLRLGLETWARVLDIDPELASAQAPLLAFSPGFLSGLGEDGLAQLRNGKPAPGTRRQVDLCLRVDIRRDLPRINAPTLVVGCTLDHLIPVEHARDLHRAIPHSRYLELHSGHVVFHEKPLEVVSAIRDFQSDGRAR